MTIQHIKLTFSLLFISFLPIMGMNNSSFKQAQEKISGIIEKKMYDYKKQLLNQKENEQFKSIDKNCTFTLEDIPKIAETNIDKGIVLEQHLKDVKEVESYTPRERKDAIDLILGQSFDKQQKLMGLIECANFIASPALENIIEYGLNNNLIPQELLESPDNTVQSFYQIKNVYDAKPTNTLKLVKEILPNIENLKEYPLYQNFNAVENDIKTIQYNNDQHKFNLINNLIAYNVNNLTNQPSPITVDAKKLQQKDVTTQAIQQFFATTSLPNKIALIVRLYDISKIASQTIAATENQASRVNYFINRLNQIIISTSFGALSIWLYGATARENQRSAAFDMFLASLIGADYPRKNTIQDFLTAGNNIPQLPIKEAILDKQFKTFGLGCLVAGTLFMKSLANNRSLFENFEFALSSFGSVFGLTPLPQLYFLCKYFLHAAPLDKEVNEMKKEQKNIQNLIEEFKESIKKEYKN